MKPYFQTGFLVPELEAAMEEMGANLGVEWVGPKDRDLREFGLDARLRMAFARTSPPYLELIEGPPGSVWDATSGARIHHLGYWSEDMESDTARLEAAGMPLELDLDHARYHRPGSRSGLRIELIDAAYRADFYARWGLPES